MWNCVEFFGIQKSPTQFDVRVKVVRQGKGKEFYDEEWKENEFFIALWAQKRNILSIHIICVYLWERNF